jgi:excisionase family DNA binding protein
MSADTKSTGSEKLAGDKYLTKEELREILRISRTTLDLMMKRKEIPYIKLRRRVLFGKSDIDAWLESKRVK